MAAMYLTPRELAERWSCSARHVRRLCGSGALPAMRLGIESWRISLAAVEAYEAARTGGAVSSTPNEGRKAEAPRREVRPTIDLALPADYAPVFADLWPGHVPAKKQAPPVRR